MSNLFSGLAQKYTNTITGATDNIDQVQTIISELQLVLDSLSGFASLWEYLSSALVSSKEKITIWNKIVLPISTFTSSVLSLIISNHRLNILPNVIDQLESYLYNMTDSLKLNVKTASAINNTTKNKITTTLKKVFNLNVKTDFTVDKSLIGGFIAYSDSVMLDLTYKRRINQLKRAFKIS
jgi:F-type H+-transporting ATPase subunit delta